MGRPFVIAAPLASCAASMERSLRAAGSRLARLAAFGLLLGFEVFAGL